MLNYNFFNLNENMNISNNLNLNKSNKNLTSHINFSIQINSHEHPLQLCYPIARKSYGTGWICNKCSTNFSYDQPSFYCTFCDFDVCEKCLGEHKINEINIYDTALNNYRYEQRISNGNFQWQKSSPFHKHLLTYIERGNECSWMCNKCSNNFKSKDPSFYCSLCDFNLCQKCSSNNNSDNQNFFNDKKTNSFNDNKQNFFNDNKQKLFSDINPNFFNDNKPSLFNDNKPNLFNDNNKLSLFS